MFVQVQFGKGKCAGFEQALHDIRVLRRPMVLQGVGGRRGRQIACADRVLDANRETMKKSASR